MSVSCSFHHLGHTRCHSRLIYSVFRSHDGLLQYAEVWYLIMFTGCMGLGISHQALHRVDSVPGVKGHTIAFIFCFFVAIVVLPPSGYWVGLKCPKGGHGQLQVPTSRLAPDHWRYQSNEKAYMVFLDVPKSPTPLPIRSKQTNYNTQQ